MPRLYFHSTIFCMVISLHFMSTPVMSADRNGDHKWTPTKMFEKKDTNKDGLITLEEFKQKDKNNDGIITRSEWTGR